MDNLQIILEELEKCNFKVSTDTRAIVSGSIYFALKGDSFDGNEFIYDALKAGSIAVITDDRKNLENKSVENIYFVENVLKTLQSVAKKYREKFNIPIIVIGGSNGKTTSKELLSKVLKTKYKVHATKGSLNNHFGLPLSILSMERDTEIAIFEIGANHPMEHTDLLNILCPTHVVVTNNGMDHLEGFGSPEGSRKANKELYDWALIHKLEVFVNKKNADLLEDSKENIRILYPTEILESADANPLTILWKKNTYKTHLVGNYNLENIELALSIGQYFKIDIDGSINSICEYIPTSKRSEWLKKDNINFIIDCYNANPTSMHLAIESFLNSKDKLKGVILGDMLELGEYTNTEHIKIIEYVNSQKFDCVVFIGENFKKAMQGRVQNYQLFPDSDKAREWFVNQKFNNFTFLLKGSRGMKIEKILEY